MNASLKNFGDIEKSRYQNIYIKSIETKLHRQDRQDMKISYVRLVR